MSETSKAHWLRRSLYATVFANAAVLLANDGRLIEVSVPNRVDTTVSVYELTAEPKLDGDSCLVAYKRAATNERGTFAESYPLPLLVPWVPGSLRKLRRKVEALEDPDRRQQAAIRLAQVLALTGVIVGGWKYSAFTMDAMGLDFNKDRGALVPDEAKQPGVLEQQSFDAMQAQVALACGEAERVIYAQEV